MPNKIAKTCIKCNTEKEITEFYTKEKSKDGYRNSCKLCECEKSKLYNIKNKEIIFIRVKKWGINNPEKLKRNNEKFYLKNPEYKKIYDSNNRDKKNKQYKKRRDSDVSFKLKENIRHLISNSLKYSGFKKNTKTDNILGCNTEDFRKHIESQWCLLHNLDENGKVWMNWDNYGNPKDGILELNKTWDIDHKIPLKNGITEEDIIKLNNYSNLQPLCSKINRINKRAKLNFK